MKQSIIQRKRVCDLPECEEIQDYYEIVLFDDGQVEVINAITEKLLRGIKNENGFLRYKLQKKTGYTAVRKSFNRLIALAFITGYEKNLVVSHKDKNCNNYKVSNLEWIRQKDIPRTSKKEQKILKRVQINELPECEGIQDYYCLDLHVDGSTALFSKKTHKYLKTWDAQGYLRYTLMNKDGTKVSKSLHRLTALAFVEGYEPELVANHIDRDKKNANVSNLEWITQKNNLIHAFAIKPKKQKPPKMSPMQISSNYSSTTYQQVEQIFELYNSGMKQKEIGEKLGLTQPSVSLILKKKRWKEHPSSVDYFKKIMVN